MEAAEKLIPVLLGLAVLLPLASFWIILIAGRRMGKAGEYAAHLATAAIAGGFGLSLISAIMWFSTTPDFGGDEHHASRIITDNWYTLARFGSLEITIGYYIDSLTIIMFLMVTLIATCIHFYAMGYMHDELHDITDHEVTLSDGSHLHRPGRYHRFFQYLSLFCFSMLGLVIAGNVAMTFVFWELVGICSYFLIGFYVERQSASTAANKAFIVNRVGDFGFIIGLMAIWSTLGTFNFGDIATKDAHGHEIQVAGIFSQVRPEHHHHELVIPEGMLKWGGADEIRKVQTEATSSAAAEEQTAHLVHEWEEAKESSPYRWAYILMIVAGIGVFAGCVGKSAQFPLHTWLPDAMEGPTPVSALVHSATMVAAGVFLTARFYPFFLPEVLLVIAIAGVITLFMAATIAIVATDIKRVLAYSTISQLGYMMLALGLGGWLAGVLHLITHAFFKSLLFMCSGSVIHAVHTNEMPEMGGLLKKMPITGYTMLVGCLAIAGMGIPFAFGFSGYYSKDAILEQAFHHGLINGGWLWVFFFAAAGGATITAFYMFRLWFMTFVGQPRDQHRYDHAHESPKVMTYPLILLAIMAIVVAWPIFGLRDALDSARHIGTAADANAALADLTIVNEHATHAEENFAKIAVPVTMIAFGTATFGIFLAAAFYWLRWLNPAEVRDQFRSIYNFLLNKWWFDELYDWLFIRPTLFFSKVISTFDRRWIDGFIDGLARCTVGFTRAFDFIVDRTFVDGPINLFARWTYSFGRSLREIQTGRLRQYVLFIVVATVAIFVLLSFFAFTSFAK